MATKTGTKAISYGICRFCQGEIAKSKMTLHLKGCKQRAAANAAKANSNPELQPSKLFHIVAEGRYNPQYWLHLEMSASDTLEDLDMLLKDIWLSCCGHLSAFKIGTMVYESAEDWSDFPWEFSDLEEKKPIEEETETDEVKAFIKKIEAREDLVPSYLKEILLREMIFPLSGFSEARSALLAEMKQCQTMDELLEFLQKEAKEAESSAKTSAVGEGRTAFLRELMLKTITDELATGNDMSVKLEKVLKVGKKFSYDYDFGSTTHLALKVVSEREGIVFDEEEPILARNVPPVIPCLVCGKPAEMIASGYYSNEHAYCSKECAKQNDVDYEETLPVVNSPRVGVCCYSG